MSRITGRNRALSSWLRLPRPLSLANCMRLCGNSPASRSGERGTFPCRSKSRVAAARCSPRGLAPAPVPSVEPGCWNSNPPVEEKPHPDDLRAQVVGGVKGANPRGYSVALYAQTPAGWHLAEVAEIDSNSNADFTWRASTRYATRYMALLVHTGFTPDQNFQTVPRRDNDIIDVKLSRIKQERR